MGRRKEQVGRDFSRENRSTYEFKNKKTNRAIFENKKGKMELHFRIRRENRATFQDEKGK